MKKLAVLLCVLSACLVGCTGTKGADYKKELKEVVAFQKEAVSSSRWEESIAPGGKYENKVFSCYIDGEWVDFDLSEELTAADEWDWTVAGVFRREGEEKTYVCLRDINMQRETVQVPQLMLLEFDTENPQEYTLYPYELENPQVFGWEVDACYRMEEEIYVSFRNETVAINTDTKELRNCEKEVAWLETYAADKAADKESLHNFRAVSVKDGAVTYAAQISENFTDTAMKKVYVTVKDGEAKAYAYVELTQDGQITKTDIK